MRDGFDPVLERQLADLGEALDYPSAPHLAAAVQARLADAPRTTSGRSWRRPFGLRPLASRLVLATVLLLLVATGVAAASLLLPGLRVLVIPGPLSTPPAATASLGALGDGLGLGVPVAPEHAPARAGFAPVDVSGTEWGAPQRTLVRDGVVTQVWATREGLRDTRAPGVGLIVTQIAGRVDEGWYEKQLEAGEVTIEQVDVGGSPGWWLSGDPHVLVYVDRDGRAIEETRRVVGDVLIWRLGDVTLRIESGLGRDATLALGDSIVRGNAGPP